MANPLYIMSGIMTLAIIGLAVYFIRLKFIDRDDPEDKPLFENFMPQYADGHTDGIIEKVEYGDERTKVVFSPRDNKYIRLLKKRMGYKVKPIILFFDKKFVTTFSEGGLSSHRQKIKGFPSDVDLLPEGIKDTPYGNYLAVMINDKCKKKDESELMKLRQENLMSVSKKTVGLNLVKEYMDMRDAYEKDNRFSVQNTPPPKSDKVD